MEAVEGGTGRRRKRKGKRKDKQKGNTAEKKRDKC
jgi:hypothetical protein